MTAKGTQCQLPLILAIFLLVSLEALDQAVARQPPAVDVTLGDSLGRKVLAQQQQQQQQQQQSDGATPQKQRIWLYLGVGAHFPGASIQLKHYIEHYIDHLGFDPQYFLLSVNFNSSKPELLQELEEVKALLVKRQLPYHLWKDEFSVFSHIKVQYALFTKHGVQPTDWIAMTDLDEMFEYPVTPVAKYVEQLGKEGANWVRGWLQDRVALGGELPAIQPSPSLAEQFPLRCALTYGLYKGYGAKVVLARAYWGLHTGNHYVVSPDKAPSYFGALGVWDRTMYKKYMRCYAPIEQKISRPSVCKDAVWKETKAENDVTIGHFKWHRGVVASVTRRLAHYKRSKIPWYRESEAILAHLQGNDMRINVTEFSCQQNLDQ